MRAPRAHSPTYRILPVSPPTAPVAVFLLSRLLMLSERSELIMTVLMTPDKANFSGKVHGGALLKYLDEVAYACASRYAGHYVVTMSVDQVNFRQPINVGEMVTFLASVNYTGTTSMEIGIKLITEDIHTKTVRHTNRSEERRVGKECRSRWSTKH